LFSFQCPGCGKQHVVDKAFDQAFEARCLRCGDTISVTEDIVHDAPTPPGGPGNALRLEEAISRRLSSAADEGHGGDQDGAALAASATESIGQRRREGTLDGDDDEPPPEADRDSYGVEPEEEESRSETPEAEDSEPVEAEGSKLGWKLWAMIAAGVIVLVGGSAGVYFGFFYNKSPDSQLADSTKPKTTAKKPTSKQTAPATTKKETEPPPPPRDEKKLIRITAPRLSAELNADPEGTNLKYKGTTLEVSGLYEQRKEYVQLKSQLCAYYAVDGREVLCSTEKSPTPLRQWLLLVPGQSFTARGVYAKDGLLENCELRPPSPPADDRYQGKDVEIEGWVDSVIQLGDEVDFPTVRFEVETYSRAEVECLFRKVDALEVKKIVPNSKVVIHGTCRGRSVPGEGRRYKVRLDNCQLVYTSAPTPPVERVSALQFSREYEEDLRRALLPPPGSEERIDTPYTLTQLGKELASDPSGIVDKKFRNKMLIVSGFVAQKSPNDSIVTLDSGDTDQRLKAMCYFTRRNYRDMLVDDNQEVTIRGLCTGMMPDGRIVRLDNCERFDISGNKDPHRLTTDYAPFTPGRSLTYDIVTYPTVGSGKPSVARQMFLMTEGGFFRTVITNTGTLQSTSLFDQEADKWVTNKKTLKVRLPGPDYFYRLSGGFVEIGARVPTKDGGTDTIWEPVLKIGARLKDSWKWTSGSMNHEYRVMKFEDLPDGRRSVTIMQTITNDGDPDRHSLEVRHVYIRGVGEVEQRQRIPLSAQEWKMLSEKRLVEDSGPPKPPAGDRPVAPGPERPRDDKAPPPGQPRG
jgi:hypothetical protein